MGFFDLVRPKWRHSDWRVRQTAVECPTDQAVLAEIAKSDLEWEMRSVAVKRLIDHAVLFEIATSDQDQRARGRY